MNDPSTKQNEKRADRAWAQLVQDVHEMGEMSDDVIQRGRLALRRHLPALIGVGVGLVVLGTMFSKRRVHSAGTATPHQEHSLLEEVARSALVSIVGVLGGRLAARLSLPLSSGREHAGR